MDDTITKVSVFDGFFPGYDVQHVVGSNQIGAIMSMTID